MGKLINVKEKKRFWLWYVGLTILLISAFLGSLCIGRYGIGLSECLKILIHFKDEAIEKTAHQVIFSLRLPRTITAAFVGASLSLSGVIYQSTFQNKLASPDILGVTSGSCVGAALAILFGLSSFWISGFAFVFGIFTVGFTIFIQKCIKNDSTLTLVLSGVIVGALANSAVGILKYLADPTRQLADITYWIMGSLAGIKYAEIGIAAVLMILSMIILLVISWRINILSLGEEEAKPLGINYKKMRYTVVICATLLTAASVSISGSVGWVGLVVPHLARLSVGEDCRKSMPAAMLFGSSLMIIADTIARTISVNEIPLNIITGILFLLPYIILLRKKGSAVS